MPPQPQKQLTIQQYLNYSDGSGSRHELVKGKLKKLMPVTPYRLKIVDFLVQTLASQVSRSGLDYNVSSGYIVVQTENAANNESVRFPDIVVIDSQFLKSVNRNVQSSSTGLLLVDGTLQVNKIEMAIEILVSGQVIRDITFNAKYKEYEKIEIPEYWIVDLPQQQIVVHYLQKQGQNTNPYYRQQVYKGEDLIDSRVFPDLVLSAGGVLTTTLPEPPIYNAKGVRVTRTILEIKGKQYQIRNIDSIQETRIDPDTSVANNFIIIGVLIEMLIYVYALPDRLLVVGLFLIFVGIISRNFLTPTYGILILTTGGQEIPYNSEQQEEIKAIKMALETAIARLT